ncbi:hypothetical protein [Streptomyces sp. ST2-7A]|uniref:hypothetical protein n=1 Tax=Streptomyces sp. ST2-7A TaxID=2907214 RepID=UPI001F44ABCF|nr:hypothetical protein [Streptomyces sp. ST2-7A]MCE7082842.1 hypothetical protein [Streptomyces sp. ST2-7A]
MQYVDKSVSSMDLPELEQWCVPGRSGRIPVRHISKPFPKNHSGAFMLEWKLDRRLTEFGEFGENSEG